MKIERRAFGFEVRADGEKPVMSGHAAMFGQEADIMGVFRERIDSGAFKTAIGRDDVRALWNHNPDYVLGRNKAGTLQLKEDETGLAVEIDPPDTQWARDLMVSMKRGDVSQMSFGFRVTDQSWERVAGKLPLRIIRGVELFDVSPVTYPAYEGTDIHVRSSADVLAELNSAAPTEPPAEDLTAIRQRFEFDRKRADFSIGEKQ
jgi:HK97 family phage prohead protease